MDFAGKFIVLDGPDGCGKRTQVDAKTIACRCGEEIDSSPPVAVDAAISRCGSCAASVSGDATRCDYCGSVIVRDPDQLSLICPECFGRCANDARFCTACGVAFCPELRSIARPSARSTSAKRKLRRNSSRKSGP